MSKLIQQRKDTHEAIKNLVTKLSTSYSEADAAELRALDGKYQELNQLVEIEVRAQAAGKTLDEVMDRRVVTTGNKGSDEEIRSAFINYVRSGDLSEVRNLNTFSAAEGGVNVPTVLYGVIQKTLANSNVIRQLPGIKTITTTSTTTLPIVGTGVTALWKDQAPSASYAETNPAFTSATLGAYKLTALVKLSDELIQDSATDLETTIASEIGTAFGNAEETAFVSGSGVLQPTGIIRQTSAGGTNLLSQNLSSASGSILADLVDGFYKMKANKRAGAVYVVGSSMASVMRKSRSSTGEFLWSEGLVVGAPATFNGVQVFESDALPSTWMSTTGVVGMLVNPTFLTIGDRGSYNLRRLNELYAAEGNVGYIASKRCDIALTSGEAVVKFVAAVA